VRLGASLASIQSNNPLSMRVKAMAAGLSPRDWSCGQRKCIRPENSHQSPKTMRLG